MHAVDITDILDERISELVRDRLPDEPVFPSGESRYATFMMPRDEIHMSEKSPSNRSNGNWMDDPKTKHDRSGSSSMNGSNKQTDSRESVLKSDIYSIKRRDTELPPFLSPTLPPMFCIDEPPLIPLPLSPTLPGAFQRTERKLTDGNSSPSGQKRKRDETTTPQSINDTPSDESRKSPPPPTTSTTPKKSVSLNEYKKRKNTTNTPDGPLTPTLQKTQPSYVTDSPRQPDTKPKDEHLEAKAFADKSQRYLARGTSLKREADKLSRTDQTTAAVTATHAILYFMSAFACDDQARKLRGKLQVQDNWKSTSDFILWVINLQKDNSENELEGLCHQLHAICHQRLFENELRYLRSCHKTFEKQRQKDNKNQIEPDDQFWRVWTESTTRYSSIAKLWRIGQSKLSEVVLRGKFPTTWKNRETWGAERGTAEEGEFGAMYRLPLGIGSSVSESIGFAQSILKEFVIERGIKYPLSEL